ncbi:MAG: substrate-binding domain-containing protein [Actinomycetaceae bacterium]|nr:substrate-binding domain-containing protein [Actinomycetaceae bacterium]
MIDCFACSSDDAALAVIGALRQCGRAVPADAAVIGCSNSMAGIFTLSPLTTIAFDEEALVSYIVTSFTALLHGQTVHPIAPQDIVDLVVRDSA